MMSNNLAIGVDLGGTKISGALFNASGMIGEKQVFLLKGMKGEEVGDRLVKLIKHLQSQARLDHLQIYRIGIAVPGIYNATTGNVWAPNIPGWEDYPLMKQLSGIFASGQIDIRIDSDRACYMLGEVWKGAAKSSKNAIYLAVGTGIGAGILVDGNILRGSQDIGGAIGWMALDRKYRKEYGRYGCFEFHASGSGITRLAKQKLLKHKTTMKNQAHADVERLTTQDVFRAYDLGDPMAEKIIQNAVRYWGRACANLVSIFNPELIIFGGGLFGPAETLIPEIYAEATKWAQPISIQQVQFRISQLGKDAGLYGAGYLAVN